jgi:predicted transcriptional regulator
MRIITWKTKRCCQEREDDETGKMSSRNKHMLEQDDPKEHKSRRLIYRYISSNPGVSFGNIKRFFDMNDSTLKYHLNTLEKKNRVRSRREGRQRCYFTSNGGTVDTPPGIEPSKRSRHLNLSKTQQRVLRVIKNYPRISRKKLMSKAKMKDSTLDYNINKLVESDLIWKVRVGSEIGYEYITQEKLKNEMLNRLVTKLLADEIDEDKFNRIKGKIESISVS